ncbi:MAG: DUF2125 domain-containing protein [Alphaproteobacteria bacterium]|nr:DUF2125 domain-containing protein [Alphaproteobacteria bacterium]
MRRAKRFGLVFLALLVPVAAYIGYWRIAAARIEDGLDGWRQSAAKKQIDASWRQLRVRGFPFAFRIEIGNASLRDRAWNPAPQLRLDRLIATARPWNFDDWRLAAPAGFSAHLAASGARPELKLAAKSAEGTAAIGAQSAPWLWVRGADVTAEALGRVPIKSAEAWITLPAKPAETHTDPSFGLALDMRQVEVAAPPVNFGKTIDELAFGVTVRGVLPAGPLAQAAAAWRDAGGTVEVDNLHLDWGGLGITASGTFALDEKLQPLAALSGGIEGFDAIVDALVAADWLIPEQGSILRIALSSLAKPGPDGKPQITAPFTIQKGKMYLGPARLGPAPRIVWD